MADLLRTQYMASNATGAARWTQLATWLVEYLDAEAVLLMRAELKRQRSCRRRLSRWWARVWLFATTREARGGEQL